jgi:tetratricopeptide (TPR) repeat protein
MGKYWTSIRGDENLMVELDRVMQLIEDGEVEKGLKQLKKLRETADHNQLYTIAELYNELGLIDQAEDIIQELKAFYPDEYDLLIFEAELLIEQNNQEEAILVLEQIPEDVSVFSQAQLLLADLYYLDGLDEVSEQKLLKAKASTPDEAVIDLALAEFYFSQSDYIKSLSYYQTILKTEEKMSDIVISLRVADLLSKVGQFEEALPYYEQGFKIRKDPDATFGYGITALSAKEYKKAINAFRELESMDSHYFTLYPNLAKALEGEGAVDEAYNACVNGLKVDEYNEELYLDTAKLAVKLKKWKEGEQYLREAVAINPSYIEAALMLISLFKDQERYEEIIELIEHIEGFEEEVPEFHWYLATAYRETENYQEALKQYQFAYNYFTSENAFLEEYGYYLIEEGRRKEARKLFEQILKNDPTSTHIEELLFEFDE